MNVIRFRITMEEHPDVVRVIDIPAEATFEDLHLSILQSVDFDASQLASFYICNENWEKKVEITLIEMDADESDLTPVMGATMLADYVGTPGQKIVYEYDFVLMWRFMLETESISESTLPFDDYPQLVESVGDAPEQYDSKDQVLGNLSEEDTQFIHELEIKNMDLFHATDGEEDEMGWEEKDDFFDEDDLRDSGHFHDDDF